LTVTADAKSPASGIDSEECGGEPCDPVERRDGRVREDDEGLDARNGLRQPPGERLSLRTIELQRNSRSDRCIQQLLEASWIRRSTIVIVEMGCRDHERLIDVVVVGTSVLGVGENTDQQDDQTRESSIPESQAETEGHRQSSRRT
jgi:hypothetical protein